MYIKKDGKAYHEKKEHLYAQLDVKTKYYYEQTMMRL
jgi:hypothetical protein